MVLLGVRGYSWGLSGAGRRPGGGSGVPGPGGILVLAITHSVTLTPRGVSPEPKPVRRADECRGWGAGLGWGLSRTKPAV